MSQYYITKKYQSPSKNWKKSTFEGFVELDDVGVVETGHGVYLLEEELFEERVLGHFLFGDTLHGVKCWWGGGFGREENVTESAFAQAPDWVEMIGVEEVFGLEFQVAFEHSGPSA
jgi:hypothetical protein